MSGVNTCTANEANGTMSGLYHLRVYSLHWRPITTTLEGRKLRHAEKAFPDQKPNINSRLVSS